MTAPKWYAVIVLSLLTVIGVVFLVRQGAIEYNEHQEERLMEKRCLTTTTQVGPRSLDSLMESATHRDFDCELWEARRRDR